MRTIIVNDDFFLEKLLRSLHKDRHHTLMHYKNLVEVSPDKVSYCNFYNDKV